MSIGPDLCTIDHNIYRRFKTPYVTLCADNSTETCAELSAPRNDQRELPL